MHSWETFKRSLPDMKSMKTSFSPAPTARFLLWAVSGAVLLTYVAAMIHLPVWVALLPFAAFLLLSRRAVTASFRQTWPFAAAWLALMLLWSIPFFVFHQGLPTGDSQKAIYWAQHITEHTALPDYSTSSALLNRDPVDFYTPGLHTFTALAMQLSPAPLTAVGLTALALACATVVIAWSLGAAVLPRFNWQTAALIAFVLMTQIRFLRYLHEPGYHYQNIIGELFLFAALWLVIELYKRWRMWDVVLLSCVLAALLISHQFSAFLAAFVLAPSVLLIGHAALVHHRLTSVARAALAGAAVFLIIAGFMLGLHEKVPHLFTTTPHLLQETPTLAEYPLLMGAWWGVAALGGLVLLWRRAAKARSTLIFIWATVVIILLSQAPRFLIDIPPVRALLYAALPLSITAAWLLDVAQQQLWLRPEHWSRRIGFTLLLIVMLWQGVAAAARALPPRHEAATNSTLQPGHQAAVAYLKKQPSGVVVTDDYNRRATSWLLLSGQPTYARLAADISRPMAEAQQSPLREKLYLTQLDIEKIYSLGSLPEIGALLAKHDIRWLVGAAGTSAAAFTENSFLEPRLAGEGFELFAVTGSGPARCGAPAEHIPWLLTSRTLANDIGDTEDTYEHLPASLRAARLSSPHRDGECTARTTTAPLIPLQFNVRDYVYPLWDADGSGAMDTALELLVRVTGSPTPLSIRTPTGKVLLLSDGELLRIESPDVRFGPEGFVTMYVENPRSLPLAFDLIALGPARTP
jgi:hypothetical protein